MDSEDEENEDKEEDRSKMIKIEELVRILGRLNELKQ